MQKAKEITDGKKVSKKLKEVREFRCRVFESPPVPFLVLEEVPDLPRYLRSVFQTIPESYYNSAGDALWRGCVKTRMKEK